MKKNYISWMAVEKVLEDLLGECHGAGFLMISLDELKNRYEKLNLNGSHIKKTQNGTFISKVYWCIENRISLLYPNLSYEKNKINGRLDSIKIEWTPIKNNPALSKKTKERKLQEHKKWILQKYSKKVNKNLELL